MKKISIYVLSLNYGGAEKAITSIANILSEKNEVIINSIYNYKPFFKLNDNIKINYLLDLKPNKDDFKIALKNKKIFQILKEGLKAIKILYLKRKCIIKELKKDNSDIIITTRKEHNYYLCKYANKDIIKIGQEHNDFYDQKNIKKVIKGAKKLDYFMPASKFLSEKYSKLLNGYPVKIKYIPHSIKEYKLTNGKKENQIIAVGRLENVKAFEDTIKVFEMLNNNKIKLKIVGEGSQEKYLKSLSKNPNIIFTGKMGFESLMKEYEKSLLLISTSKSESFGLVALEAANAGVPTICFDSANGLKEIIENNKSGIIIKDRDINKMTDELSKLINNPELLQEYSKHAKVISKKYYEEEISKKWNEFVKNIGN